MLIVGLGEIGREVARLAEAFGMHVLSTRRNEGNLDELLPRADSVVITLPLTEETRGLFDRRRIELMKPGAIFVNIGRGPVVDEEALIDALRSRPSPRCRARRLRHRAAAGRQPAVGARQRHPQPAHRGAVVHENERIVELFADNLRRYLAGEELRSRIRTDLFY